MDGTRKLPKSPHPELLVQLKEMLRIVSSWAAFDCKAEVANERHDRSLRSYSVEGLCSPPNAE